METVIANSTILSIVVTSIFPDIECAGLVWTETGATMLSKLSFVVVPGMIFMLSSLSLSMYLSALPMMVLGLNAGVECVEVTVSVYFWVCLGGVFSYFPEIDPLSCEQMLYAPP